MNADLARLIRCRTRLDRRRRRARSPSTRKRAQALDERLENAREAVDGAKSSCSTDTQNERRAEEKEVSRVHQGRLAKYKDQALEVKTNREYHAMHHEMAIAQDDIKAVRTGFSR